MALLLVTLSLAAAPARAEGIPPEAEAYVQSERQFERGKLLLDFGEFDKAVTSLKRAWGLYHDEKYLLWLARAYDKKESFEAAIRYYGDYLAFGALATEREVVETRVAEIRSETRFGKELVAITVEPEGAEVYLDDLSPFFKVSAPARVFVPWGEHQWIVKMDDHRDKIVPFTVEKGKDLSFDVRLSRIEFFITATLQSKPDGAEVSIDGKVVGKTPVTVKVKEGYYTVRMIDEGLAPFEKLIEFTREADNLVVADLQKGQLKAGTAVASTAIDDTPPDQDPELPDPGDTGDGQGDAGSTAGDGGDGGPAIYRVTEPTDAWLYSGWSLVGTGVAGLAAGGVFSYLAFSKAAEAEGWSPTDAGETQETYDAKLATALDDANSKLTIATIAYAAGGAVLATGVTFLVIDALMPEATAIAIIPTVDPDRGQAGVVLHMGF